MKRVANKQMDCRYNVVFPYFQLNPIVQEGFMKTVFYILDKHAPY